MAGRAGVGSLRKMVEVRTRLSLGMIKIRVRFRISVKVMHMFRVSVRVVHMCDAISSYNYACPYDVYHRRKGENKLEPQAINIGAICDWRKQD